ncbi:hypothetical protein H4219_006443 [Mycoemilia scoparia]|uniref:Uncharacterized protein n=1 Tax=Mycoemilia scoparia TaxID=417184 RepID=A0A9W8DLM4_9FUNG|nr:hypothetical protein H4219_006443 [Mycoemilia scoparia]
MPLGNSALDSAIKQLLALNIDCVTKISQPTNIVLKFREITSAVNIEQLNVKLGEIDSLHTASIANSSSWSDKQRQDFLKDMQREILAHAGTCLDLIRRRNATYREYFNQLPDVTPESIQEYKRCAAIKTEQFIDELAWFQTKLGEIIPTSPSSDDGGDDAGFLEIYKKGAPLSSELAPAIYLCLRVAFAVSLQCVSFNKTLHRSLFDNVDKDDSEEREMDMRLPRFGNANRPMPNMTRINFVF